MIEKFRVFTGGDLDIPSLPVTEFKLSRSLMTLSPHYDSVRKGIDWNSI